MSRHLVTGASTGLGEIFARRLASRGCDLVIVARRGDLLDALADELRRTHGVRIHVVAADLAAPAAVERLKLELDALDIVVGHVVNNAGYGMAGPFARMDAERQLRMIDLNCRVPTEIARAFLPGMIERGGGGILNVASTAAFQAGPWMAVYYATKAFLLSLTEALHHEVRGTGVSVTALCPGPTRTGFFAAAGIGGGILVDRMAGDPHRVVDAGLKALDTGRAIAVPGIVNRLGALGAGLAPRALTRRIAGRLQRGRSAVD